MGTSYYSLKALHRCVRCGKKDAYTLNGRALCFECCEKQNKRILSESQKEKAYQHAKKRYYERKEAGMCVTCGKKRDGDCVRCSRCEAKNKTRIAERRKQKGITIDRKYALAKGICYRCCKNPIIAEKRMCASCYQKAVLALEKARKKQKNER